MKFAYADPPYFGCAAKLYGKLHSDAVAYDRIETHANLIRRLCDEYEGWALSLNSPSLRHILPLCPDTARIGAWVKPFAAFKPGVNPGYAWEPIIFNGGRNRGRDIETVRDWTACNITLKRGFCGAKPEAVCWWIFDMLGARDGDEFHDVFPGSGAVSRAWRTYCSERLHTPMNSGDEIVDGMFPAQGVA